MVSTTLRLSLAASSICLIIQAQTNPIGEKGSVSYPNFNIREAAPAVSGGPTNDLVERRKQLLLRGRGASFGVFGLPKSWLNDGSPGRERRATGQADPGATARLFLSANTDIFPFERAEIDNLRLVSQVSDEWQTVIHFNQTVEGLDVFHGLVRVTLDGTGEVVEAGVGDVVPGLRLTVTPRLTEQEALRAAFRLHGLEAPRSFEQTASEGRRHEFRNPLGARLWPLTGELVAFPMGPDSARLGYRIVVDGVAGRAYEVVIDAEDGTLLFRNCLTSESGTGRVFRESPLKGARVTVNFPDSWLAANQLVTIGNNVDAYVDANGDDIPDSTSDDNLRSGRAYSATQLFSFPAPGDDEATVTLPKEYIPASVTNLFYLVNTAHDFYYGLGFTEEAGNFQTSNFGRGGKEGDAVLAEAQFGSQFGVFANNANFTTPPDGRPGRMRVGIFTDGFTPPRDGDLDGHVIVHEYGHGVSGRLVGGGGNPSCVGGPQSGAMGEGWSDYFAISFYNAPLFGAYTAKPPATTVRRSNYEGYRFTYEDLGNAGFEVHNDGEIWAATLWDLRKQLTATVADKLVVAALKVTPCAPSMIDGRNAILVADRTLNKEANRAAIWQVFAKHGMGFSASGPDNRLANAAFDLPADLQPGNRNPVVTSAPGPGVLDEPYSYAIAASDPDGGTLRYALTEGPAGMTVNPTTGVVQWTPTFIGARAKVTITDGQGGRVVHTFFVRVETPLTPGRPITIGAEQGSIGTATIDVPANTLLLQVTMRGGTGNADLFLRDPSGALFAVSFRNGNTETMSVSGPAAGRWAIQPYGYDKYSGVSLTATFPTPTVILPNTSASNLSDVGSGQKFFRVPVPAGGSTLRISTTGASGMMWLFLAKGRAPACGLFLTAAPCPRDQFSAKFGTNQEVSLSTPGAGDYYLELLAATDYAGGTVDVGLTIPPTVGVDTQALSFTSLEGGAAPASRSVRVFNTAGAAFNWTATSTGGAWLRLATERGTGDSPLVVSVAPAGLAIGTYRGTVSIAADGLARSPATLPVVLEVTPRSALKVSVTALRFTAPPGTDPDPQSLLISNSNGGSVTWSASASVETGSWLSIDSSQGSGILSALRVSVRTAGLAAGEYKGKITINSAGTANSPLTVDVGLLVGLPVILTAENVLNGGALTPGFPLAPGLLTALTGQNMAEPCTECPEADGFPLPLELAGTRVTVNGAAAPLVSVSPSLVMFVVPFDVSGDTATVVVSRGGLSSDPVKVQLQNQSIGVMTVLGNGSGAAVIYHGDGTLVSRDAPLRTGETIQIYTVGLGAVTPAPGVGGTSPAMVDIPLQTYFDGIEGEVLSGVLAPELAGIYKVTVHVPDFLARQYPVIHVQNDFGSSQDTSAGGASLFDVTPAAVAVGADIEVRIRGINLPAKGRLRVGELEVPFVLSVEGAYQVMTATIPAAAVSVRGTVDLVVDEPENPGEEPSNVIRLRVQ